MQPSSALVRINAYVPVPNSRGLLPPQAPCRPPADAVLQPRQSDCHQAAQEWGLPVPSPSGSLQGFQPSADLKFDATFRLCGFSAGQAGCGPLLIDSGDPRGSTFLGGGAPQGWPPWTVSITF